MLDQIWLASQRYVRLFVSETVDDAMADHRELLACCERARRERGPSELLRLHLDRTELAVREAFAPDRRAPSASCVVRAAIVSAYQAPPELG